MFVNTVKELGFVFVLRTKHNHWRVLHQELSGLYLRMCIRF